MVQYGAVWCSVVQCVIHMVRCFAVCCSVLRCGAVWCSMSQCGTVCRSVVQFGAVCCSVLQCVAVCCSVLQCVMNSAHHMCVITHAPVSRHTYAPVSPHSCTSHTYRSHKCTRLVHISVYQANVYRGQDDRLFAATHDGVIS